MVWNGYESCKKLKEDLKNVKYQASHLLTKLLKLYHFQAILIWWHGPFNYLSKTVKNVDDFSRRRLKMIFNNDNLSMLDPDTESDPNLEVNFFYPN